MFPVYLAHFCRMTLVYLTIGQYLSDQIYQVYVYCMHAYRNRQFSGFSSFYYLSRIYLPPGPPGPPPPQASHLGTSPMASSPVPRSQASDTSSTTPK